MTDSTPTPTTDQTHDSKISVLITGASSGTGRALIRELVKRGHAVMGAVTTPDEGRQIRHLGALPVYPQLDRVNDVRGLLHMRRVTHIVHLAHLDAGGVPQYNAPEASYMPALRATDEIVSAAGRAGVKRILFPSFGYLYQDTPTPASETSRIQRNTPLLAALADAESAVLDGGIPGYVLRCGYLYGAGTRAMREIEAGLRQGRGVANGYKPAAWLHEEDLAAALLMLIEQPVTEGGEAVGTILNIADNSHLSPNEFLSAFSEALGMGAPNGILPFMLSFRTSPAQRDALNKGIMLDTSKIRAMGWTPRYPTAAAGLERTLMVWRAEDAPDTPEPEHIPERAIVLL